jgi:predicted acetyltransferase
MALRGCARASKNGGMTTVELQTAPPSAQAAMGNMLQLYMHDFADLSPEEKKGELGEDGRFELPDLSALWREPDLVPLLIRADGRLAGFCVLNRRHHGARPVDWNVAEFFVVRKHRRTGVGAAAATQAFQARPGVWEVAVRRQNPGAQAFWRRVIEAQPGLRGLHELSDASDWEGPVFRFSLG